MRSRVAEHRPVAEDLESANSTFGPKRVDYEKNPPAKGKAMTRTKRRDKILFVVLLVLCFACYWNQPPLSAGILTPNESYLKQFKRDSDGRISNLSDVREFREKEVEKEKKMSPNAVLKLKRCVYGLGDAPRGWFLKLKKDLENGGFVSPAIDPSVSSYFAKVGNQGTARGMEEVGYQGVAYRYLPTSHK